MKFDLQCLICLLFLFQVLEVVVFQHQRPLQGINLRKSNFHYLIITQKSINKYMHVFNCSISPPVMPSPIYPTPTSPSAPTGYDSMPSPPTFDNSDPTGFGGEPTESPNSADFTSFNILLQFTLTFLVVSLIAVEF